VKLTKIQAGVVENLKSGYVLIRQSGFFSNPRTYLRSLADDSTIDVSNVTFESLIVKRVIKRDLSYVGQSAWILAEEPK